VFAELLRRKLAGIVDLSESQIGALEAHYSLMLRWNAKVNLTTITGVEEAVERHYCESLFLGAHLPAGALRIVDVGSGPGFPGFPVAILRPDCDVTLVESHRRKAVFLSESARGHSNIEVVAERAEEVQVRFDHAISRAVSYDDLLAVLKDLAPNADLLTGVEVPPADLGFQWRDPIPLPWGKQRFLRVGSA
jgi:16S rRNA (guanine527-N7)-methyltransferase